MRAAPENCALAVRLSLENPARYLVFPSVSLAILQAFDCDTDFDNDPKYMDRCPALPWGERACPRAAYLSADLSIDCNSNQYLYVWKIYSLLFVFIYPIGSVSVIHASA